MVDNGYTTALLWYMLGRNDQQRRCPVKIAVISDIHDNIWNLADALTLAAQADPGAVCVLGDLCAPFIVAQIANAFSCPIHIIFGNNDGDPFLIGKVAAGFPQVTVHGQLADLTIDGVRIALNHYPQIAEPMALSGVFQAVFSGHDHQRYVHRRGTTLWANPGEVMGRFGSPSFGLYDLADDVFQHVEIPPHLGRA